MKSTTWFHGCVRGLRLLAVALMLVAFVGCGGDDEGAGNDANDAGANDASNDAAADDAANDAGDDSAGDDTAGDDSAGDDAQPEQRQVNVTDFLPDNAALAVSVRPAQILNSDVMQTFGPQMGLEQQLADIQQKSGLDPRNIDQVLIGAAGGSQPQGPPTPKVTGVVIFNKPVDLAATVKEKMPQGAEVEEKTHGGTSYLLIKPPGSGADAAPAGPPDPANQPLALYTVNSTTYVVAPEHDLLPVLERGPPQGGLADRVAKADLSADVAIVVSLVGQEGLMQLAEGMAQAQGLGEQAGPAFAIAKNIDGFTLTFGVGSQNLLTASADFKDEATATQFETQATGGLDTLRGFYQVQRPQIEQHADLVNFADKVVEGMSVTREGNTITATIPNPDGLAKAIQAAIPLIQQGIQGAQGAAGAASDANTLKQIGLALHNYHDVYGSLPPNENPAVLDEDGQMKVSWRVHLLAMMDAVDLANQIEVREPWDSEKNKTVLTSAEHPFVSQGDSVEPSKTRFRMFSGKGTLLPGGKGKKFAAIKDGLSNTIAVIQVGPKKAVEWYKPGTGIAIDSEDLIAELGEPGPKGWRALFLDGRVVTIRPDVKPETLKALVTVDGGEVVQQEDYLAQSTPGKDTPQLAPVEGRIVLDGVPLPEATVVFTPVNGGRPSVGITDEEGHYKLQYTASKSGAIPGRYRVAISAATNSVDDADGDTEISEKLPPKYNTQSELQTEVKPGSNTFNFDLVSQ